MKRLVWDRPWFVLTSSWKEPARLKVKSKRGTFLKGMYDKLFQANKLKDFQNNEELSADKNLLLDILFLLSFLHVPFLLASPPPAAQGECPIPLPLLNSRLLHEALQCTFNIRRHPATGTSSGDKSKTLHAMGTRTRERYPALCLYCTCCPAAMYSWSCCYWTRQDLHESNWRKQGAYC